MKGKATNTGTHRTLALQLSLLLKSSLQVYPTAYRAPVALMVMSLEPDIAKSGAFSDFS